MKTINVTFEDSEIEIIEQAKEVLKTLLGEKKITWHKFVVLSAEEVLKQ